MLNSNITLFLAGIISSRLKKIAKFWVKAQIRKNKAQYQRNFAAMLCAFGIMSLMYAPAAAIFTVFIALNLPWRPVSP